MAIPQEYIAELSRRIDITELIGSFVQLKRAGRLERGLCPFHNEKSPSFYVYPDTASFYCFGCGAGGDAITFVKNIQNLDYSEAVRFLAARVGMPMPEDDDETSKIRGRTLAINREAARFFATCLNSETGGKARAYLRGRGLSDSIIRRFGLGYAPDEYGAALNHLKRQGFTEQEILTAGICKKGQRGPYDAFRGRAMFPIIDLRGNVIAFGGRAMADGQGPKYLNSSDTPVFKKSRNLFALQIANKAPSRRYILAEGYMDVISLHQAGFSTAVATLGTAITAEQAKLLSDYADELVICYDADEAGQKATARAIAILKETPLRVSVLTVPDAKDPDEFIRKYGAERFAALLDGSKNTIEYALFKAKEKQELNSPEAQSTYLRAALDVLAANATPTEQDIYAGRLAEETGVSKSAILTQLETVVRLWRKRNAAEREKRRREEGMAASINLPPGSGGSRALDVAFAEQQLMAAALKNPQHTLAQIKDTVQPAQFLSPEMSETYTALLTMQADGELIDFTTLASHLSERATTLMGRILAQNHDTGFTDADLQMFIERILQTSNNPANTAGMDASEYASYFDSLRKSKGVAEPENDS